MPRARRQFLLVDLVGIVLMAGLFFALVLAFGRKSAPADLGLLLLMFVVAVTWILYRGKVTGPVCVECGRRFVDSAKKRALPRVCPHCGEPQLGRNRRRELLTIGLGIGLSLVVLDVLAIWAFMAQAAYAPVPPPATPGNLALLLFLLIALPALIVLLPILALVRARVDSFGNQPTTCESCGASLLADEPKICSFCRQRLLPSKDRGKEFKKNLASIFVLALIVAILVAVASAVSAGTFFGPHSWIVGVLRIVALAVVLVVAWFAAFIGFAIVRQRRMGSERHVLALARRHAGVEGEVTRVGTTTFWCSSDSIPVPTLNGHIEQAHKRLEALLGKECVSLPALHVLCFDRRAAFDAFHRPFVMTHFAIFKALDGVYFARKQRLVTACTEQVPYRVVDPERTIQHATTTYLLQTSLARTQHPWMHEGVARLVTTDGRDRCALNRAVLASLARGTSFGTRLFSVTPLELSRFIQGWDQFGNFERLQQFGAESRSVVEFLSGAEAPEERREQFQAFLRDPDAQKRSDKTMWLYFGFGHDELVARWRAWVTEQGIGSFKLPDPFVRHGLLERVVPLIKNRQANVKERILAIRWSGTAGHVLAGSALVELLTDEDSAPKEEIVWALEAISGVSYGDDVARWTSWWQSLPAGIAQAGLGANQPQMTSGAAIEQSSVAAGEYNTRAIRSTDHESA
jgi:predicted RNA-binding Zn-ribbon protein involved in translation (DUF1610 family)